MFCYHPGFLDDIGAARLARELAEEVAWHHERLRLFGREVAVPRLVAWFGDPGVNYRYSAMDHLCAGWPPALAGLRDRLGAEFGMTANLVLLNRYLDGSHYMGWHADDERGLAGTIVSLSLGATRRFLVKPPGAGRSRRVDLESGSVLVMDGGLRHTLPRTRRPVGERINLTFRRVQTG